MDIRSFIRNIVKDTFGKQYIPEEVLEKIYLEIEKKVDNEPPPRFAFIGQCGVGKSSTLNALFNAGLEVSHTEACTQRAREIAIKLSELRGANGAFIAYDMPGLGESRLKRDEHLEIYENILKDVDVALWILDAQNREIASVQSHLEDEISTINPDLVNRMVFALNKVDLVYPGETAWHPLANLPSEEQEENIKKRILDVTRKVREVLPEWRGTIVGYSARKRYNLPQLFATMLDAVPKKRQWVVASRKAIAEFLELVDPRLLPPDVKRKKLPIRKTQEEVISDLVQSITPEELSKISRSKEALEEWLKQKMLNQ